MPFAAITFKVKPGHEDEIREIFDPKNFKRVSSPLLRNEQGEEAGMLLGTALFVKGDTVIRVIHYEGATLEDIARNMSDQEGIREAERRFAQFLPEPRTPDTQTPEGFIEFFHSALMTKVSELTIPAAFLTKAAD
jgi:SchA/CurD like domain